MDPVDFDEELQVEEDDDVNEDIPLLQKAMLNERVRSDPTNTHHRCS